MTEQYLVGEASLLLAHLQTATPDAARAREVALLRHEVEETPPARLGAVVARALRMADDLCWESLDQGDVQVFSRQCACSADLRDFCICAQLITDG
jgi:hypothetical protein